MKGGFGFPFASIYSAWRRLGLAVAAGSPIAVPGPLCSWGALERADPGFQHRVSSEARELSRVWGLGSPARDGARVPCIARQGLTTGPPGEALKGVCVSSLSCAVGESPCCQT